jgi:hypothetical protein
MRWLRDQTEAMVLLNGESNVDSFEHVPGWLHGKLWSSPHQANIVCGEQQAAITQCADGHTLKNTFLAFPVLKSMAICQWDMNPDAFPVSDETPVNGANPIVHKRFAPARVQAAIEACVQGFLVRFQFMVWNVGLSCIQEL